MGARRLVDGVTDPTLSSGVFYASPANAVPVPWSTKPTSSPTWPTHPFRTTPTKPSTASSPNDVFWRASARGSRRAVRRVAARRAAQINRSDALACRRARTAASWTGWLVFQRGCALSSNLISRSSPILSHPPFPTIYSPLLGQMADAHPLIRTGTYFGSASTPPDKAPDSAVSSSPAA